MGMGVMGWVGRAEVSGSKCDGWVTMNLSLSRLWGSLVAQSFISDAVYSASLASAALRTAGVWAEGRLTRGAVAAGVSRSAQLKEIGLVVAGWDVFKDGTIMSLSGPDFGNLILFLLSVSVAFQIAVWVELARLK